MAKKRHPFPQNRPSVGGFFTSCQRSGRVLDTRRRHRTVLPEYSYIAPGTDRPPLLVPRNAIGYRTLHALRRFFKHVADDYKESGGRWVNLKNTRPTKPGTSATYDCILRAFVNWLPEESEIETSPMERGPKPVDCPEQLTPFSEDYILNLLAPLRHKP
jgi:hypothetical protein